MKKPKPKSLPKKYDILDALLFDYGMGKIDSERFEREMAKNNFTQQDIDDFCVEYYEKEAKKIEGQK